MEGISHSRLRTTSAIRRSNDNWRTNICWYILFFFSIFFLFFNLGTLSSNAFSNSTSIWSPFGDGSCWCTVMQSFGGLMLLIMPLHLRKLVFFIQTLKQLNFRCLYMGQMAVLHLFSSCLHFLFLISLLIFCSGAGFCYIIDMGIQWKVDGFKSNWFYESVII